MGEANRELPPQAPGQVPLIQPQLFFEEMAQACRELVEEFERVKSADPSDPQFNDLESALYLKLTTVRVKSEVLDEEVEDAMVANSLLEGQILDLLFARLEPGETEEDTVFTAGEQSWEADLILRTADRVHLIEVCLLSDAASIYRTARRLGEGLRVHRAAHPGTMVAAILVAPREGLSLDLRRKLDAIDGLAVYAVDPKHTELTEMRIPRPVG